jgi:hypothetical protein
LLFQLAMKQIMALLLGSALLVPILSTEAFCAKPSASTAAPKKAPRHKRHGARHGGPSKQMAREAAGSTSAKPPTATAPEK